MYEQSIEEGISEALILDSVASDIGFMFRDYFTNDEFELDQRPEAHLAEFFELTRKRDRELAISFIRRIDEIDLLRENR